MHLVNDYQMIDLHYFYFYVSCLLFYWALLIVPIGCCFTTKEASNNIAVLDSNSRFTMVEVDHYLYCCSYQSNHQIEYLENCLFY
jgi:hypothetical protein